jgi:Mn-dependent DtxR family transcriptional regulator
MPESLEILKMRVLICFLNENARICTVTGLAAMFGEGKQKMHRIFATLEKEGLLNRSNPRSPVLTELGREKAHYYENRINIVLNHLLYEGLDMDNAEHDAYAWALFSSDKGMEIIKSSEQRYRAKYELRKREQFDGTELCKHLHDGEYRLPFLIYKEHMTDGNNLSMSNGGFEHPCILTVTNGEGTIQLRPKEIWARSQMTGQEMIGRVRMLMYWDGMTFKNAETVNGMLTFPASTLSFLNIGSGMEQILHGSVCLKMQCSVGTNHMPEATAIFAAML